MPAADLRHVASLMYDVSPSSMLVDTKIEINPTNQTKDVHILRRFVRIAISLIRMQLRSLIVCTEQSIFLVWKLMIELVRSSSQMDIEENTAYPKSDLAPFVNHSSSPNASNNISSESKLFVHKAVQRLMFPDLFQSLKRIASVSLDCILI